VSRGGATIQVPGLPRISTGQALAVLLLACVALGGLASYDPILGVAGAAGVVFLALLMFHFPLAMSGWVVVAYLSGLPGLIGAPALTTLLVGGVWLVTMASRREQVIALRDKAPLVLIAPVAFFGWMVASSIWASDAGVAHSQLWLFFTGLVTAPIVATAVNRPSTANLLIAAYVAGAALIVLLAIVLGPDSYVDAKNDTEGRLQVANFSANLLGATSATALILVPAVLGAYRSWLVRLGAVVAAGLLAYGLVGTQSRSGFIALGVAAIVALLVCRGRRTKILGAVVVTMAVLAAFVAANPAVLDRVSKGDSSGTGRTELWAAAAHMWEDHPVLGVGVGNFTVRSREYSLDIGPVKYVDAFTSSPLPVHNFVLESLAETGVIGLVLLLAALIACMAATFRAGRAFRALRDDRLEFLAQLVFVAQSSIVSAGLFLPITYSRQLWMLLGIGPALLGIAVVRRRRAEAAEAARNAPPPPPPRENRVGAALRARREAVAAGRLGTTGLGIPAGAGLVGVAQTGVGGGLQTALLRDPLPGSGAAIPGVPAGPAVPAPLPGAVDRGTPPSAPTAGPAVPAPETAPNAPGATTAAPADTPLTADEAEEPSFKRGVGWSLFALIASKFVSFLALLVLARILVPDEFGIVAAVTMYLAFLEIASDLGVKAVVVYEQERGHSERVQTAFTLNLMIVAGATVIGLLLAWPAASFFGAGGHVELFFLCVFSLTCTGASNVHDGLLLRELSLGKRVLPQLARGVVQAIVSITLAFAGLGASALVIGVVCGSLAWTVVQWTTTKFRPNFTFDAAIAKSMIAYAAGAWMFFVTSWVSIQADTLVVGNQLNAQDLGVYSMAYRLPELLVFNIAWMLSTVAFPALARERAKDDSDVVGSTVGIIHYLALYALPMAAGLAVLAPVIINVLFSSTWSASAPVLSGVAIAVAMITTFTPVADAAKAVGRQWAMVGLYLLHIPMVVVAVVYADRWGPEGVAWASVVATVLFLAMLLTWTHRALGITIGKLAVALRAPLSAAVGVAFFAGIMRVALLGGVPDVVLLVIGGLMGTAGAFVGVALFSPGTLSDLSQQLGARKVLARLRPSRVGRA
jgi:O-antigen/teichoic acid export membrane protein/O-antigen ligase